MGLGSDQPKERPAQEIIIDREERVKLGMLFINAHIREKKIAIGPALRAKVDIICRKLLEKGEFPSGIVRRIDQKRLYEFITTYSKELKEGEEEVSQVRTLPGKEQVSPTSYFKSGGEIINETRSSLRLGNNPARSITSTRQISPENRNRPVPRLGNNPNRGTTAPSEVTSKIAEGIRDIFSRVKRGEVISWTDEELKRELEKDFNKDNDKNNQ